MVHKIPCPLYSTQNAIGSLAHQPPTSAFVGYKNLALWLWVTDDTAIRCSTSHTNLCSGARCTQALHAASDEKMDDETQQS